MSGRRAWVIGTGLIGSSIGRALRELGWHVSGSDLDAAACDASRMAGALDATGADDEAEIVFVCVPASSVCSAAASALATSPSAVVTDVAGVKGAIVGAVGSERFVGGHPMAGSEKEGVDGAEADLFRGRSWVLTPTGGTDPSAYALVHGVVSSFGARVISMAPERHDELVALVSHVPHLLAATLMNLAGTESQRSPELLPMAAGGFRDMTRVAAGAPEIWPDICADNAGAIATVLRALADRLTELAGTVQTGARDDLLDVLRRARSLRSSLPASWAAAETVAELRVPILDRPGALAEVTSLAAQLSVNIEDVDIDHSPAGGGGELVLLIDARRVGALTEALIQRGYAARPRPL